MLFMVIESFKPGRAPQVYRRFKEKGRMAPAGVRYLSRWVDLEFERCFQVMEADQMSLLEEWMSHWKDLVEFEVIPVRSSADAAKLMADPGPL